MGVRQSIFHKRGLFVSSFLSLDADYVYPGQSQMPPSPSRLAFVFCLCNGTHLQTPPELLLLPFERRDVSFHFKLNSE